MTTGSGPTRSPDPVEPGRSALSTVDLAAWFADNGRDLPWRRIRDPWAVVVSELMLQQTQVERVVPRWRRFLDRFPTVAVCAAAPVGDVIDEWSGLGYNRRAVNLHRLAVAVVDEHAGSFPQDRDALEALPGIGPYTSRAVRVFAFELGDAVLDTNVARILARVEGRTLGRADAQRLADANLGPSPWHHNQALLARCRRRLVPTRPPLRDLSGAPGLSLGRGRPTRTRSGRRLGRSPRPAVPFRRQ